MIAEAEEAINGLSEAIKKAANAKTAQEEVNNAKEKVEKVKELDKKYDTTNWDKTITDQQKVVDQIKEKEQKEEADQVAANKVKELIDALPTADQVTIEHEGTIKAAREAFNKLTAEQKALVDIAKLEAVESTLKDAITNEQDVLEAKRVLDVEVKNPDRNPSLNVLKAGEKGTSIVWESTNSKYADASTGKVNRPNRKDGEQTVTLTATITKGKAEVTQTFTVKVPVYLEVTVKKN
ncbi:immunoglobulin-like domain-containing protein [Metabacillus fastidiosus]|uniref:immunoglobulin-like domain-containing protein n=1 Tax=Metabacillus fastidiosus TaxID=1458 RepID=UPI002E1E4356|nr:hypothetical protein [Metabacillus fastidiosus]